MATSKSGKGNTAGHRMNNKALQARRASSWNRGQERKALRRKEQAAAETRNAELRAQGLPTPWEVAQAERALRRAAERAKTAGRK